MKITSKEHYDLMQQFEKDFRYKSPQREPKDIWHRGAIYCNGEINQRFIAYRMGYAYAQSLANQGGGYRMNTQKVVGVLKRAGYTPTRMERVRLPDRVTMQRVPGYQVMKTSFGWVSIECCFYGDAVQEKVQQLVQVLVDAGLDASELRPGCGIIKVKG